MLTNFAILDLGTPDLIIVLAIILLLFGGKKLPELSRSLGTTMRELRKGLHEDTSDVKDEKKPSSQEQTKHDAA